MKFININDDEFDRIREIMHKKTGVFLKDSKKPLVTARLRKRLETLNLNSYNEYIKLLESSGSNELEFFINAITTNETYLFRHIKQFEILEKTVLPEFLSKGKNSLTIWSAAASTGEEPYSIAIVCNEFALKNKQFMYKIYATDINSDVLSVAKEGIYLERSFRETPPEYKKKYFKEIKSDDGLISKTLYAVDDSIKRKIIYTKHNLLDMFDLIKEADIVFLRNVMIYFEKDVKEKVVTNIYKKMAKDGYLFISLSESLNDIKSDFVFFQSGVYKKYE